MIKSQGTHAQLNRAEREGYRESFGVSLDIIADKDFGPGGTATATLLMRQQYNDAVKGNVPAIQIMLELISANLMGRKIPDQEGEIIRGFPGDDGPREPSNADIAMMILGIAALDDAALASSINGGGEFLPWRLGNVRPTRVERWVADYAAENNDLESDPLSTKGITDGIVPEDRANVRIWDQHKDRIIAALMRAKGPGTTKFQPGQSGNRKGRPRKLKVLYPYDDFLMEPVTLPIKGKKRTLTRLDGLMLQLSTMGLKDRKIGRMILKVLRRMHELEWNKIELPEPIIRG